MKCPRISSEQSQAETRTGAVMTVLFAFMAPARRNVPVISPVEIIARSIQNNISVTSHFHAAQTPEELDQVSGGTGTPYERDTEDVIDKIKLAQQSHEINQTLAEMKNGQKTVQLPLEKLY